MTSEPQTIILDSDGRPTYAVPTAVLEQHRATPEQRAAIEAARGDVEGFSLAPDQPLFQMSPEALEPYRLSDEQREAQTAADDVNGFSFTYVKMIERPSFSADVIPLNPYFIGPKQEEWPNPVYLPGPGGLPR